MILIDRILFDTDLFVYSFSKDHTSPVGLPTNPCFPVQHDVGGGGGGGESHTGVGNASA